MKIFKKISKIKIAEKITDSNAKDEMYNYAERSELVNTKKLKFTYLIDNSDIYRAITNGDCEFFYFSRMQSKTIHAFRYMNGTCFHLAVKHFQMDICRILLAIYGFDPKEKCGAGYSPLHWIMRTKLEESSTKEIASQRNAFMSTLNYLLSVRSCLNPKDNDGLTPLHYAAKNNNEIGAKRLLKELSIRIDEMDNLRQTPLHLACKYSSDRVFKAILESDKLRLEHLCDVSYEFSLLHSLCRANIQRCDMTENLLRKIIELKLLKTFQKHRNQFKSLTTNQKFVSNCIPVILDNLRKDKIETNQCQKVILNKENCPQDLVNEITIFLKEIVNRADNLYQRPLQIAIEQNYLELVDLLYKYGALSISHTLNRTLPIHVAAKVGNSKMFFLLQKHNSISLKSDSNMNNLLHIAINNNKVEFLKNLCHYLDSQNDQATKFKHIFDAVNSNYLTPLFLAVSKSNIECVQILIDINPMSKFYVDDFEHNIFHMCCMFDSLNVFKYLLGLIERSSNESEIFYECNNDKVLVEENTQIVDPIESKKDGKISGNISDENVKFESLIYKVDSQLNTILHLSAIKSSTSILNLILNFIFENKYSFGTLLTKKNANGETFFQIACNEECLEIVERMLKHKRFFQKLNYNPLDDYDNNLNNVLLSSILKNRFNCVKLLLAYGANSNILNKFKQNGLHLSCSIGDYEMTECLIKYGCEYLCFDAFKMNPLDYACQSGNQEMVKLLMNLKDAYMLVGSNCLSNAIAFNHPCIVDLLLKSKYWTLLMNFDNKSSIIKDLIEKMPDKMELLLDKSFDRNTNTYNFRLIDTKLTDNRIENHPLYLIMNTNDERLVTHHTVRKLLELKSKRFPRIAFLLDLSLYIMFTFLCTIYHLISMEQVKDKSIYKLQQLGIELHVSVVYLIYFGLVLALTMHLTKEIFQMITYKVRNYFSSIDNWFQLSALGITLISLIPKMPHQVQIAIGSFSILLAWICMSLFFQDLELFSLGKYIVAFRKTIQNSLKFMPFFFMICLGFFFSYKVGERMKMHNNYEDHNKRDNSQNAIVKKHYNFIKIITMMIGELDSSNLNESFDSFEEYFKLENIYNTAIFLCFVFMMCIIVLSLFEGIAVGEIKEVLDKAHIEIISSNIFYVLKVQAILYLIYTFLNKDKEPTFMNIYEHKLTENNKNLTMNMKIKKIKKNRNIPKKIENDLMSLSSNFISMSKKIDELNGQVRNIKKLLEF